MPDMEEITCEVCGRLLWRGSPSVRPSPEPKCGIKHRKKPDAK